MNLEDFKPSELNERVGDIIGAARLTRWDLYVGPHYICGLAFHRPEDKAEVEAFAKYCNTKPGWGVLAMRYQLKDRPKGMRVKARMVQWHCRYSDTPAGGWEVVAWLGQKGPVTVHNNNPGGWTVTLNRGNGARSGCAKTMAHAACLVALEMAKLERGAA